MERRYVSIWFRHLETDWFTVRYPHLAHVPFVLSAPSHGRMLITSLNPIAFAKGLHSGMALADARAIVPELEVMDEDPGLSERFLNKVAEWCIRYSPVVSADPPDGIIVDATGCTHLWGGEQPYLSDIEYRLTKNGYHVRAAIADTPSGAWAVARYGKNTLVEKGRLIDELIPLPPEALRLEDETVEKLLKLGLNRIGQFINMPRSSLRRRFGVQILEKLSKIIGSDLELIEPVIPPEPYHERLPSFDPVCTAPGIAIALEHLLKNLCLRLSREQKGIRTCVLKCYRVDGKVEVIRIGTNRPTHHVQHLFKLFELKLGEINPGLGIELFVLEAPKVDPHVPVQEKMWEETGGLNDVRLSEFIDRLEARMERSSVKRYIPAERYWPERSFQTASSLQEISPNWIIDPKRPLQLLEYPEKIDVTAPVPDYPPMLFRHKGKIHNVVKADGPERIEQEWWISGGKHRDYYRVEDQDGNRYWIFRSGHYDDKNYQWFLHGYFA